MCGLAEILNQILVHVYDPMRQSTEAEFFDCVQEEARNLGEWWDELPDYLKLVATDLPPYSPPSHIMTLKYVLPYMSAILFFLLTMVLAVYITLLISCSTAPSSALAVC